MTVTSADPAERSRTSPDELRPGAATGAGGPPAVVEPARRRADHLAERRRDVRSRRWWGLMGGAILAGSLGAALAVLGAAR